MLHIHRSQKHNHCHCKKKFVVIMKNSIWHLVEFAIKMHLIFIGPSEDSNVNQLAFCWKFHCFKNYVCIGKAGAWNATRCLDDAIDCIDEHVGLTLNACFYSIQIGLPMYLLIYLYWTNKSTTNQTKSIGLKLNAIQYLSIKKNAHTHTHSQSAATELQPNTWIYQRSYVLSLLLINTECNWN